MGLFPLLLLLASKMLLPVFVCSLLASMLIRVKLGVLLLQSGVPLWQVFLPLLH
jgi:hypothetical protein